MKYYYRSELAKIAGINIETLRYYENEQLIPIPKRNPNGYRLYSENTLTIINFIKNAKSTGFSLGEIKNLFLAINGSDLNLEYLDKKIDEKIDEVNEKILKLERVKESLMDIKKNIYVPHECPLCKAFKDEAENNINT